MKEPYLNAPDDVVDNGDARTMCSAVRAKPPKVH